MSLTPAQREAVAARGNVLVVAGAGTGKTTTLVERCLHYLLEEKPRARLDEILMVTFTEAAAAEMRQRIREELERVAAERPEHTAHCREQLAIFETAHIGTLHSFCFKLVREHFYELNLDPQFTVLSEEEDWLLAEETLDDLLEEHYAGRTASSQAVQELVAVYSQDRDDRIRRLILRLHRYAQTQSDLQAWIAAQEAAFSAPKPQRWNEWLVEGFHDWRLRWIPTFQNCALADDPGHRFLAILSGAESVRLGAEMAEILEAIRAAAAARPAKPKGSRQVERFLEEMEFLLALAVSPANDPLGKHPLESDWEWAAPAMRTLVALAAEFAKKFDAAKRELGVADFQDLEQYALRLLWDPETGKPGRIAEQWRQKLRFVFVDEYQDINAAQDRIIQALSREGAQANRFLVGDVKQSIYRFRLANPAIFQRYSQKWRTGGGRVLPLKDNFRSREPLLGFVNAFFGEVMQPALGGLCYDEEARLVFGAPDRRSPLTLASAPAAAVELHVRVKGGELSPDDAGEEDEQSGAIADLLEAEKEARLIGLRLHELKAQRQQVWDKRQQQFRAVEWSDMAVLLRAPANKAESWAKEFGRLDIPLVVERGGFFSSIEVLDLLNLFQILDNPLQDVPLLGVLHSPLVGMTIRELASVRLAALKGHFWSVLVRWADSQGPRPQTPAGKPAQAQAESEATLGKVRSFLERYARWRNLARQTSLSRCLENILAETHYLEWLLTQPRGEQRQANVQRLLRFAEQFDQFQRQGLFRFLRFIEARQKAEAEPEVPAVSGQNAVRLMSIHQSKGLEFPIVVAPDLGKRFNLSDLWSDIILDERYGLCPKVKSPETGKRYPSLPYWLARHRQTAELLGEEMRLFYVTMTRACDRLILSATVSKKRFEDSWRKPAPITPATLSAARSCADWLGIWAAGRLAAANGSSAGSQLFSWTLHDDTSLLDPAPDKVSGRAQVESAPDPAAVAALERRLAWQYPFPAVTRQPAKTSVSVVRRQAAQQDDELASLFAGPQPWLGASRPQRAGGKRGTLGATEIGDAHHLFLELVSLNAVGSVGALEREARRLVESKAITPEQHSALDLDALAAFWQSDLGRSICAHSEQVRRELPFTARFSANELETLAGRQPQPPLENEFVVVQGVADLAILGPSSIRLVDFKTDALKPDDLAVRARFYRPQLHLYALALARIYRRPVTDAWLYFLSLRTAVAVPLQ